MNKQDIDQTILEIRKIIPKSASGADKADILVFLALELGLSHLLIPEALPDQDDLHALPEKAPELYRRRKDKSEKPCDFIARVYAPWFGKGLAKHHIMHLDKTLYMALANWLLRNDKPDWFILPTKKELNDMELERLGLETGETLPYPSYYKGLKDKLRLYNAARNRRATDKE